MAQQSQAAQQYGIPWWYRYIHSWRARMWLETGIWER